MSEETNRLEGRLAIAGQLFPLFTKLVSAPFKIARIWKEFRNAADIHDFFLLIVITFGLLPLGRIIFDVFETKHRPALNRPVKDSKGKPVDPFLRSYSYTVALRLTEMAKIAIVVYVFDVSMIVLHVLGFEIFGFGVPENEDPITIQLAKLLYTIWGGVHIARFKRKLLTKAVQSKSDTPSKMIVYDRILDTAIFTGVALTVLHIANYEVGPGLGSLFAVGGIGTFVFGLASKDLASQLVSALVLTTSEKFVEGDYIRLGDSTCGVVTSMAWTHTELRGSDDIKTKIPNSDLMGQKIANLSRMTKSQVYQTLRFDYNDVDKLPALVKSIKAEILSACRDDLILDGSRPFRVAWTDLADNHLAVTVDCHFNIAPIGDPYWNNRQKVLSAIVTATKNEGVKFHVPKYLQNNTGWGL